MTTSISPSLGHGVTFTQQGVGTAPGYDAIDLRRPLGTDTRGEGVATYGSFRVSQRAAGANMSVDVNMDEGAWVRGDAVSLQGLYYVPPHSAAINEAISAAHATLPRIDQVVLEVKDHQHDASGSNLAQVRVVNGTATGGATLDNRTGAAALPSSSLLLADVLIAAADTSITDAEIRDRRAFTAGVPPLLTDVDMVALTSPAHNVLFTEAAPPVDLAQSAVLVYVPRRIVAATRIRWHYAQGGTAITGNYVLAIYDASGRKIIDTGSVAFAATNQERSEVITATTFEPGAYYLLFGVDSTNGGSLNYAGWGGSTAAASGAQIAARNMALRITSGGVTPPQTLAAMTDAVTLSSLFNPPPMIALSVG